MSVVLSDTIVGTGRGVIQVQGRKGEKMEMNNNKIDNNNKYNNNKYNNINNILFYY